MKTLKTILLTIALLLASTCMTIMVIAFAYLVVAYMEWFALLFLLTMVGLFISWVYQIAHIIITEREDKK